MAAVIALVGALIAGLAALTMPTAPAATAAPGAAAIPASGSLVAASALPAEFAAVAAAESAQLAPGTVRHRIHFHFKKNHKNPSNSRLILYRVTYYPDKAPVTVKLGSWRAGSGNSSTNACASNQGWLPNGRYDGHTKDKAGVYFNNYNGGLIFGIVWHLEDKRCKKNGRMGIKRTELFIHSEMTPDRKQACIPGIDSKQCWEGKNDYLSKGCIKLKPRDIAAAARLAKAWGGPKPGQKRYPNLLIVTS